MPIVNIIERKKYIRKRFLPIALKKNKLNFFFNHCEEILDEFIDKFSLRANIIGDLEDG